MWIIARAGFYSIVEKNWDKPLGLVTVRARRREDLEALRDYVNMPIVETLDADYPYRCQIDKGTMATIVARMILDIDYDNFKNTQGDMRHGVYISVWAALRRLEPFFRPWRAGLDAGGKKVKPAQVQMTFPLTPIKGEKKRRAKDRLRR